MKMSSGLGLIALATLALACEPQYFTTVATLLPGPSHPLDWPEPYCPLGTEFVGNYTNPLQGPPSYIYSTQTTICKSRCPVVMVTANNPSPRESAPCPSSGNQPRPPECPPTATRIGTTNESFDYWQCNTISYCQFGCLEET